MVGAFACVLALAVLGWAAASGAASPVVSTSSEFLPSGRPTAGRRPDSWTGGRGALHTSSWTNQSNATLTNAPTVRQGASPDAGGGSVDRPLPPRCLAERNQQITGAGNDLPSYTYANRAERELGYSLDRSRSAVPTPPPISAPTPSSLGLLLERCATVFEVWCDTKPQVSMGM